MDLSPLLASRVKAEDLPLDRLASNTHVSEPEKIVAAGHAFEALLLRQVLQEAQRPAFPSKYANDSASNGIYRDLMVEQLAEKMAKSNSLGLAQSLASGLQRQLRSPSAPAAPGGGHDPVAASQARLPAGGEPVSGSAAARTLSSPKMRGLSDREGRAPCAVCAKTSLP